MNIINVGDRVDACGSRGIVRYIGLVDGHDGEWIGIDWDDPGRGKHDGSVKGKRYFQATFPKSGSFVRPKAVCAGKDLLSEMKNRYMDSVLVETVEFGSKSVDFVNMEKIYGKQKDLWKLRVVAVDNMKVAKAPPEDCSPFKFCTELNLYNNLLSRWCDLLDIIRFFPSLRFLIASRNYMESDMSTVTDERKVLAPIRTLVLGECHLNESTTKRILSFFPHVRQIHLDRNDIERFDPGEHGNYLESIDLEGNPINDFANLHVLSTLPNLKYLNVAKCGFHDIQLPVPVGYQSLSSLIIKGNALTNNRWMSELAKLPRLEKLFCNWSTENGYSKLDIRELIIAKIPQLKMLDNSEISAVERRSSEIHFLNQFGIEPVAEENRVDVERLIKIHGEPTKPTLPSESGIDLLKLKLAYEGRIIERSLPESITIQKLTGIVSRLFRLNARKISLQICSDDGFVIELDKPLRPLNFYSLSDADIIRIINI